MARTTSRKHPATEGTSVGLDTLSFLAGQAAEILGIEVWRLQKFLNSPEYHITMSPYGHLGKGRGSRRVFRPRDLYRIGIAACLVADGFAPWLVAEVMQSIEKLDLKHVAQRDVFFPIIALRRRADKPEVLVIPSERKFEVGPGNTMYYFLDLREVISRIDQQIEKKLQADEPREGTLAIVNGERVEFVPK